MSVSLHLMKDTSEDLNFEFFVISFMRPLFQSLSCFIQLVCRCSLSVSVLNGICVFPENIHTPPHRRDWKFVGGLKDQNI